MIMRIDEGKGIQIISLLLCWASYCFPQCQLDLPLTMPMLKKLGFLQSAEGGGGGGGEHNARRSRNIQGHHKKSWTIKGATPTLFKLRGVLEKCPVQSSIIPSAP